MKAKDHTYICEACGQTTTIENDTCPNCGAPMTHLDEDEPTRHDLENEEDVTDFDDLEKLDLNSHDDTQPLSLEALREGEDDEDDYPPHDDFGDDE